MLIALFEDSGVEIEGTSADLHELSQSIRACGDLCRIPLSVPAAVDDRGLRYLKQLLVRVDSNSLNISTTDQELVVSGARDKLDLFSDNIDWLVASRREGTLQKRDHLHVEFYPGHFFLSEDALPLLLVRQD
jgi:hypothetical protein